MHQTGRNRRIGNSACDRVYKGAACSAAVRLGALGQCRWLAILTRSLANTSPHGSGGQALGYEIECLPPVQRRRHASTTKGSPRPRSAVAGESWRSADRKKRAVFDHDGQGIASGASSCITDVMNWRSAWSSSIRALGLSQCRRVKGSAVRYPERVHLRDAKTTFPRVRTGSSSESPPGSPVSCISCSVSCALAIGYPGQKVSSDWQR